jgi:hypothetical protein
MILTHRIEHTGEPESVLWRTVNPSFLKAILTDAHFWAPVVVLIVGVGLLVAMR